MATAAAATSGGTRRHGSRGRSPKTKMVPVREWDPETLRDFIRSVVLNPRVKASAPTRRDGVPAGAPGGGKTGGYLVMLRDIYSAGVWAPPEQSAAKKLRGILDMGVSITASRDCGSGVAHESLNADKDMGLAMRILHGYFAPKDAAGGARFDLNHFYNHFHGYTPVITAADAIRCCLYVAATEGPAPDTPAAAGGAYVIPGVVQVMNEVVEVLSAKVRVCSLLGAVIGRLDTPEAEELNVMVTTPEGLIR